MGPRHMVLPFLIIGLLCVTQIASLSLRRATDEPNMAANMLDLARAADVKAACPRSDTFCLPRVKCPVKSVVYDREGQRFLEGADKFKDNFGCGAFSPTWTYVCCSILDKLEEDNWRPSRDLWFFPSRNGSEPAKDVDPTSPFPIMLPWPGFEDVHISFEEKNSNVKDNKTHNQAEQPSTTAASTTEKPKENKQSVRSTVEQPTRGAPPQQTVSPPPMMTTLDPGMNNPWFNPNNAPMFNQPPPWMFPPSPGNFDPRLVMQNLGLQDPRLLQSVLPMQRSDWAEMILVFPDGSFQRTIRDFRTMNMAAVSDGRVPNMMMDASRRPTLDFPLPQAPSTHTVVAETEHPDKANSRSRRATTASKTFKLPPAGGGMWTAKNKTS